LRSRALRAARRCCGRRRQCGASAAARSCATGGGSGCRARAPAHPLAAPLSLCRPARPAMSNYWDELVKGTPLTRAAPVPLARRARRCAGCARMRETRAVHLRRATLCGRPRSAAGVAAAAPMSAHAAARARLPRGRRRCGRSASCAQNSPAWGRDALCCLY
jgi:hypothetical protein